MDSYILFQPDTDLPLPVETTPSTAGIDYESVTLMRMRQAERERLEREILEQEANEWHKLLWSLILPSPGFLGDGPKGSTWIYSVIDVKFGKAWGMHVYAKNILFFGFVISGFN